MSISMAIYDRLDTDQWTRCWLTCRAEHEGAFKALLDAVATGSQFLYVPVGKIVISSLSEAQILLLIKGHDDLVYRHGGDSVCVLEDLFYGVNDALALIAPNAQSQRLVAINLSMSDPDLLDRLEKEIGRHPILNYVPIEFEDSA